MIHHRRLKSLRTEILRREADGGRDIDGRRAFNAQLAAYRLHGGGKRKFVDLTGDDDEGTEITEEVPDPEFIDLTGEVGGDASAPSAAAAASGGVWSREKMLTFLKMHLQPGGDKEFFDIQPVGGGRNTIEITGEGFLEVHDAPKYKGEPFFDYYDDYRHYKTNDLVFTPRPKSWRGGFNPKWKQALKDKGWFMKWDSVGYRTATVEVMKLGEFNRFGFEKVPKKVKM